MLGAEVTLKLDSQIARSLLDYRTVVAAGRLDAAESRGQELRSLVLKRDYTYSGTEDLSGQLQELKNQLKTLRSQAANSVKTIRSPRSGLFSAVVDGYESVLTPDSLSALTPSALNKLSPAEIPANTGKLILGDNWYYVGVVSAQEAQTLQTRQNRLGTGESLSLRFTKNVDRDLSVTLLSVGAEENGPIVIKGRYIAGVGAEYTDAPALQRIDARGATAVPGFIDAHLHIESSMMTPVTFETATLPRGLTTVICDPHEIVNVMGEAGFAWFARCAEQARQNQYLQVSSCVPALEGCDVNGASFTLEQMLAWRDHPQVTGLAEMMDYPGVISGQNALLDKLDAFRHLTLDGHCPGLGGKELNAYITAGIENCHESYQLEEGRRKLQLGMSLMIREGSAARNLNALAPLINEFNSPQCMLCTDDRNPWEIAHEGHIDALIRRLIEQHNVPLHVAYRVASWSTARHFGLNHLGLLAPGKQADIVLLSDARKVTVQ